MPEQLIGEYVQTLTRKQKNLFAYLCHLTVPLAGISTDIFLPSLPSMTHYFSCGNLAVQLSVTVFIMAFGVGQFLIGPIVDIYGRKKLIISALILQIITITLILFSTSIEFLLMMRVLQGFAGSVMMVPTRTIYSDLFKGDEFRQKFNVSTIFFALGPIIGPFIGGYLQHYFGWHANFIFLLVYAFIILSGMLFIYKETLQTRGQLVIADLLSGYKTMVGHKTFVLLSLASAVLMAYSAIFNVMGPFIVQEVLHRSAIEYGHVALSMGAAWFIGNSLSRIVYHWDRMLKLRVALYAAVISNTVTLYCHYHTSFSVLSLVLPIFIIISIAGFCFPIFVGEALSFFPDKGGSANALLFSLCWIGFGLGTFLGALLKVQSLMPLSIAFTVTSLLSVILYELTPNPLLSLKTS